VSSAGPNLFDQQEANRRRSRWLVAGFILFFAWLGFGGDLIFRLATADGEPGSYRHGIPFMGIVMCVLAAGIARYAWSTGPAKVLWASGARELSEPLNDDERRYVNVVEEMAVAGGLPRPGIWIIDDPDPNAFATGRDPESSSVAVTTGLLAICSRDELQAVVAHEMSHIRNLDVRLMTLLASLVGAVALIAEGLGRMMRTGFHVGGRGGGGRGGGKRGGNLGPLVLVLLALWLISWLLAPVITRMLALGVSRKREFLADATAAQFTRNPMALATALEKIEAAHGPTKSIHPGSAHLCISDPTGRKLNQRQGRLAELFGTHPPMPLRIARLRAMAFQDQKRAGTFASPG
jgi:heat shock protein HtpX